ncbi:MAG TPA: hypothetical protein PKM59_15475, partial [Thermodesulfobacteriota bacterium]|nr:hypothetical protein [Thermodesulfobacteriota bacterium]
SDQSLPVRDASLCEDAVDVAVLIVKRYSEFIRFVIREHPAEPRCQAALGILHEPTDRMGEDTLCARTYLKCCGISRGNKEVVSHG